MSYSFLYNSFIFFINFGLVFPAFICDTNNLNLFFILSS
jgi:hypothetical protein